MNATDAYSVEDATAEKWVCHIIAAEGVIGVFGNLLVCYVILRVTLLHNMTNFLLVNLAVADLLVCLDTFVHYLTSECQIIAVTAVSNVARELVCRFLATKYFAFALSYVSAYSLCLVTLERYVAIARPLRYSRQLTTSRMVALITLTWVTSFLAAAPFLFTREPSNDPDKICTDVDYPHPAFPYLVSVFAFCFGYLLPLTLMTWAYYKMQVTLKRQAQTLNLQYARAAAYELLTARQNLVNMLKTVLGALVVLWTLGYLAVLPCLQRTKEAQFPFCGSTAYNYIRLVGNFLFNFNSVINPIIYEFTYKKFRQGFKIAFCSGSNRIGDNRLHAEMIPL